MLHAHTHIEPFQSYFRNRVINNTLECFNLYAMRLHAIALSPKDDVAKLAASESKTDNKNAEKHKTIKNQYKELNRNIITSFSLNLLRALSKVMAKTYITENLGFLEELNRINRMLPPTRNIQEDLQLIVAQRVEGALLGVPGAAAFLASKGEKQRLTVNLAADAQQLLFLNFDNLDLAHFIPALNNIYELLIRDGIAHFSDSDIRLLNCAGKIDRLAEQVFNINSRSEQILADLTIGFSQDILAIIKKIPEDLSKLYSAAVSAHAAHNEPTLAAQEALADKLEAQLQESCDAFYTQLSTAQKKHQLEKRTSKMLSNPQAKEIFDTIAIVERGGTTPPGSRTPSPSRKNSLSGDKSVIEGSHSLKQLAAITELMVVLKGYGKMNDTEIKPELERRISPVLSPKTQPEEQFPPQRITRSMSLGANLQEHKKARGRVALNINIPLARAPKAKVVALTAAPVVIPAAPVVIAAATPPQRPRRLDVIPEYRPSTGVIEESPKASSISQLSSGSFTGSQSNSSSLTGSGSQSSSSSQIGSGSIKHLRSNASVLTGSGSLKSSQSSSSSMSISTHTNSNSQILSGLQIVSPSPRAAIPAPQPSPSTARSRTGSRSSRRSLSLSDLGIISSLRFADCSDDDEDDQAHNKKQSISIGSNAGFNSLLASAKDDDDDTELDSNKAKATQQKPRIRRGF